MVLRSLQSKIVRHVVEGTKRPLASYPTPVQSCYATQIAARPPTFYHRPRVPQTSTHFALRMQRQFLQLGMSLSQALWKVTKTGLLIALALSVHTPFVLIPDIDEVHTPYVDDVHTSDIQYVIRGGRVVRQQSPTTARPLEGATSHEEVRREDGEILRQLQSTQARISIWTLLASSSTCRNALIRALSQIRVETTTTLEGPYTSLYISVGCSGHQVSSVLLDNGLALNVCLLAIAIALGYAPLDFGPLDFGPSTQTVRAYDSTKREVIGTLEIKLLIDSEIEDFCRDFMAISFDQHSSTMYGPSEFIVIPNHDVPFGLGFILTEADYRYMARLRKEMVRAQLTNTSFDYLVRPYSMSLANYFVRASELQTHSNGIIDGFSTVQETELQRLVHQLQLSDGAPGTSASALTVPLSPNCMSLMTLYVLDEVDEHGIFA
ncbi:hypothetical protein CK203_003439 [Vitis vinifera]|uniref:Uncharacterized protein n=1 Tax=Vitis vinifera TaxID=29760 RepID=A0A438K7F5_VITVI|nr:hypothetical protein CK203_003439 [Vitis vinifera]